jgi:hypothetical protein
LNARIDGRIVIRYEDMLDDTALCPGKALGFTAAPYNERNVLRAVERCSFESMRKIESSGVSDPHQGFERTLGFYSYGEPLFIRQGVVGSWKYVFGPGDMGRFNRYHGGPIPELGYIW